MPKPIRGLDEIRREGKRMDAEFEKLRQENETLRWELNALHSGLLEGLPAIVFVKDSESRFTWGNQALVRALGKTTLKEIKGTSDFDYFPRAHALAARKDEVWVMETGQVILEKLERDQYPDGSPRWAMTSRFPLRDDNGNICGIFGWVQDVTSLKSTEAKFDQESLLLKALLENIPDAVYFKDRESRFMRVSKGIHLEGIQNLEEAIGKTDADFFTEEHARQAFLDEQEIMKSGIPLIDKIEKETYPNKPATMVSTTKVPFRDGEGNITGLVGISRDVTERFKAEEAVRHARDELEIRVQERTAALVQEIKQHLKTEKALRENEIRLQESNRRLETQIRQLHFLNSTAQRLSFCIQRRELVPAIVEAFEKLHPGVEAAICELQNNSWSTTATTLGLAKAGMSEILEKTLEPLIKSPPTATRIFPMREGEKRLQALRALAYTPAEVYVEIPLRIEEKTQAVIQLFGDADFLGWIREDQVVADTLAAQAAVSLANANNLRILEAKTRVESELQVAQRIQQRFTPSLRPEIPHIHLKGVYFPAYEVGGDYLDYFRTAAGNWVVVIADVSGKGIPAALVMTMLRSTFRAEARYETSAHRLLCAVNDLMAADLDDKTFVTALCLIINADSTQMSYARAGHPPLVLRHSQAGEIAKTIQPKGLALGLVEGETFSRLIEEVNLPLALGDRILIFTDGLVEAMNAQRQPYGMERLMNLLNRDDQGTPDNLVEVILDDVKTYTGNQPAHDDLTMLAMEVVG
jgi:PAS domain S-box-containing protein